MIIKFQCNLCKNTIKKYFDNLKDVPPVLDCQCSGKMERQFGGPEASKKTTIVTGRAKDVEVLQSVLDDQAQKADYEEDK